MAPGEPRSQPTEPAASDWLGVTLGRVGPGTRGGEVPKHCGALVAQPQVGAFPGPPVASLLCRPLLGRLLWTHHLQPGSGQCEPRGVGSGAWVLCGCWGVAGAAAPGAAWEGRGPGPGAGQTHWPSPRRATAQASLSSGNRVLADMALGICLPGLELPAGQGRGQRGRCPPCCAGHPCRHPPPVQPSASAVPGGGGVLV